MIKEFTSKEVTKRLIELGEIPVKKEGFSYVEVVRILRRKYKEVLGDKEGHLNIIMNIREANNNRAAIYDEKVDIYKEINFTGFESQTDAVAYLIISILENNCTKSAK